MKFKEIADNIAFENSDSFGKSVILSILFAISIIPLVKYITTNKIILVSYCLIGIIAIKYIRVFFKDWTSEDDEIGEVIFNNENENLIIKSNSLRYSEIESIRFRFNYIKGRNYAYKDVIHNGIAEMIVSKKNLAEHKVQFLIETEDQLNYLKQTFMDWYSKGINIREEFTKYKFKTLCLEPLQGKNYEEIKELKNRIGGNPVDNKL